MCVCVCVCVYYMWAHVPQVKTKALTMAEMQAFLQRRTDEDENTRLEIINLIEGINR